MYECDAQEGVNKNGGKWGKGVLVLHLSQKKGEMVYSTAQEMLGVLNSRDL